LNLALGFAPLPPFPTSAGIAKISFHTIAEQPG
jgi:hypothetical protein